MEEEEGGVVVGGCVEAEDNGQLSWVHVLVREIPVSRKPSTID
jgi:hypothetical protein